jgi:regulator of G-protein signaling
MNSMSDLLPQEEDIRRWSLSLFELIADPKGLTWFRKFLQQEFSEENIDFYLACEEMKKASNCQEFY